MFASIGNKLTETQVVGARESGHPLHLSERTSHQVNDVSQTQTKLDVRQALNKEHCFCHQMCYFDATHCVGYLTSTHLRQSTLPSYEFLLLSFLRDLISIRIFSSIFLVCIPPSRPFPVSNSLNNFEISALSQEANLEMAVFRARVFFKKGDLWCKFLFIYHATTSFFESLK